MAISLDVRTVFRNSSVAKPTEKHGTIHFQEGESLKARHILGLDTTCINPTGRNSSAGSTATSKQRGVTFSEATTAVVSSRSTADTSEQTYGSRLRRKGSSILGKRNKQSEFPVNGLKPKISDSSIRSFYDRSRAPLSVSQQTSSSSSRDFALRRGAPSIMSTSSQEKEHVKQLRLLSSSRKPAADRQQQLLNDTAPSRASSLRSTTSSIFESNSLQEGSQVSQPSTARISITRSPLPTSTKSPVPTRNSFVREQYPPHLVKVPVDPTQARMNIRRPKVGAKNWFDSVDADSSEDDKDCAEPCLENDFATKVNDAFERGQINHHPPRIASMRPDMHLKKLTSKTDGRMGNQHDAADLLRVTEAYDVPGKIQQPKSNPFEGADLTKQSLLWLSSSEDSDNDSGPEGLRTPKTQIRDSLVNASWDDGDVIVGKAIKLGTRSPEVVVKNIRTHGINSQVPKRKGSKLRLETYLEDDSTTTLPQHDLLTSFPETPTDNCSTGVPSLRESMLSESESIRSTKLMTVTRQEERLIAAMRVKKVAMKKAQLNANRNGALRVLEQNAHETENSQNSAAPKLKPLHFQTSRPSSMALSKQLSAIRNASRQDSVTTIQTDSVAGQSIRSSIATYLSEGSEDLQLPYSSIYGLPMGSTVIRPTESARRERAPRDTFLSEMTIDSTIATSLEERPANDRDSHVVQLDPIERQLTREDIPSQLFLESPYLGWSIQAAH